MRRVDFYVLSEQAPDARLRHACRLAEQAFNAGQHVYIRAAEAAQLGQLDDLLWTFNDRSFLPHELYSGQPPAHARVLILIGHGEGPASHCDLLLNLTDAIPPDLERYAAIAEIVETDPERRRSARERYKDYRERGCELETHNV